MSKLSRILLDPFFGADGFFSSSKHQQGSVSQENSIQTLYYGIPALVSAILGLLFLIVGELSAGKTLVKKYEDEVASISKEESGLKKDLSQELRMAQANDKKLANNTETSRLRNRLKELLESKKILLSKLHSLAPEEGKYQFQLANTFFTKSELTLISPVQTKEEAKSRQEVSVSQRNQGVSIMNQIAPLDKPGYLDAHLYLAKNAAPRGAMSAREESKRFQLTNVHLDHAIVLDSNNVSALSMKVLIAERFKQLDDAKKYLKKLFESDPYIYPQLCQYNVRLGVANENSIFLHSARERLKNQLNRMTGSSDARIKCATYLIDCLHRLENLNEADKVINDEMRLFPDVPKVQLWGNRLMAISQEIRYRLTGQIDEENAVRKLELLRNGHKLDPTNQKILGHLTDLRSSTIPGVAQLCKEIYQPDEKAPASVENILGTQALAQNDYLEAAKRMTRATQKAPKNGNYLNNLAYLHLIKPDPDPEEALKLIDRAIINAQSSNIQRERLTHFFDTKGRALLELGKIAEKNGDKALATSQYATATAQLLKAMIDRPDNLSTAKAIVECYEASGTKEMAAVWSEQVKRLQDKKLQAPKNN